jgi:hypothetical protein
VIVSVHLADLDWRAMPGVLRRAPDPKIVPGLSYAETVLTAALGARMLPAPRLRRVGLIAAWSDDLALDRFLADHPLAERLSAGWQVRLEPLRVLGSWAAMPGLPTDERMVEDGEPVAVLTLGHLRALRAPQFFRQSAGAEAEVVTDPALLASTGLARPPRLLSTFSLWRTAAAMREYAYRSDGAHFAAVRADRAQPFHHESAFIRFRPYASQGRWDGHDPLADLGVGRS